MFTVAYQPILDLRQRCLVGYEALVRPDGLSPHEFFARAREVGAEVEVDLACVRRAFADVAALAPGARVFVNLRAATVLAVARCSASLPVPPSQVRVVWELPEDGGWPGDAHAASFEAVCAVLRASGGDVALDDIGEGFRDLSRLRYVRPDWIKVARSLVRGIDADVEARAIVRYLWVLARDLGASLVAEGIETEGELAACRDLGIEYGQGFLLGRPAPLVCVEGGCAG